MTKETEQEMKRAINKYLHLYLKDEDNLREMFETVVQSHAYNLFRDDSRHTAERDAIYKLSQRVLQGE